MSSARGLEWRRTVDALRAFVSAHGSLTPRRAVFCTYDLDVRRFEAIVLPELLRRGRQFRTLVLADAGALQAQLRENDAHSFGRYQISPVRCARNGVMHAKLVLLAAGNRYLVGIGSANLTAGGLGSNLEMMMFADNMTDNGRQLLGGAAGFLTRLSEHDSITMPRSVRQMIELTLCGLQSQGKALLHSLDAPLIRQISRTGLGRVHSLSIVSPWHSGAATPDGLELSVLQTLKRSFNPAITTVYTEGRSGRGPDLGSATEVFVRSETQSSVGNASTDDESDVELVRRPTRVHAKVYLLENSRNTARLYFGSANCTHPGLTRAVGSGGNVEILVGSKLRAAEVAAVRADLTELFAPARGRFAPTPPPKPAVSRGRILSGELLDGLKGPRLRIEAPTVDKASVAIAPHPRGRSVRILIEKGIGLVTRSSELRTLFSHGTPTREGESWGLVLWEKVGRQYEPFPVVLPLVANDHEAADVALFDMAFEELGRWPRSAAPETPDHSEDTGATETDDEDLRSLAEANHQGELDRLAVAVAVIRKRIRLARPEYARARLELLRKAIGRLMIGEHLKQTLQDYLSSPRRTRGLR